MKVIFICTGNTCRSPMAEGYLKSAELKNLVVESRGLFADSSPVAENAAAVMSELGINISSHVSTQFTEDCLSADLFITMSRSHSEMLESMGVKKHKIIVLGGGIFDPFGCDLSVYRACRDKIIAEIDTLIANGAFTPYSVKPLHEKDVPQIAEIEKECFSDAWSQNAILESFKAGTIFLTVSDAEKILGYVGITAILDEGYIANIAVTKAMRGKGVASILMHSLNVFARIKKLSFISLEVRASNSAAIKLYEKYGYKPEGERKNFYRNPTENAVIMTKRF